VHPIDRDQLIALGQKQRNLLKLEPPNSNSLYARCKSARAAEALSSQARAYVKGIQRIFLDFSSCRGHGT
jgi:hypothetical protein